MNNWKFGDVAEWDIPTGIIQWLIVCPERSGLGYRAIWVSGGSGGEYEDRRVTTILSAPRPGDVYRLASDD